MNEFKRIIQEHGGDPELVIQLTQTLKNLNEEGRLTKLDWESLYWISHYLYQYDDSAQSDELIIKALEQAHSSGMNPGNNRELYLDGVMMLANKYLKYGRYIHAVNYLTELRENSGELPDWAHLKYCIAMVYAYPQTVMLNPASFLLSFAAVDRQDKENAKRLLAIAKRFLDQGIQFLSVHQLKLDPAIVGAIHEVFQGIGLENLVEWEAFLHLAVPDSYKEYLPDHTGEDDDDTGQLQALCEEIAQENQILKKKILRLEEELERLREEAEQKRATAVASATIPPAEPPVSSSADPLVTTRRKRLLVFGDNRVPVDKLRRYANAIGFPAADIDFYLDYERNRRFDIDRIQYHSPYVGILIGPNAHKSVNLDDYPSMISKLKNEPGFPHTIEMRTLSGELKITKTSFEAALMQMMDHVEAISV